MLEYISVDTIKGIKCNRVSIASQRNFNWLLFRRGSSYSTRNLTEDFEQKNASVCWSCTFKFSKMTLSARTSIASCSSPNALKQACLSQEAVRILYLNKLLHSKLIKVIIGTLFLCRRRTSPLQPSAAWDQSWRGTAR